MNGEPPPGFVPANDLERALVGAQTAALPVTALLDVLLDSQVFILLDKEPGPTGVWDGAAAPLILNNPAGVAVLAVFSAPERSAGWPERCPEFAFGLLTDFRWLLRSMTPDLGVVLNPGLGVGLEIPAAAVARMQAEAADG